MEVISTTATFGGQIQRVRHRSEACDCDMIFGIFLPPQASEKAVPVLYWLSGLTCTDENFMIKAGAQRVAAELGIAIVCPDTSPRDTDFPGEHDDWDFGSSAGFYVNATQEPWSKNYRMYDYVTEELPALISEHFPVSIIPFRHSRRSVIPPIAAGARKPCPTTLVKTATRGLNTMLR